MVGSVALVGLGLLGGLALNRRTPRPPAPPSDDALMRTVVAHERAKGNRVIEADVTATKPAAVDLPKGTFAVFAVPGSPVADRVILDGGNRAGEATLIRLAKGSLPNAGLAARWEGSLSVRLTGGASAAHLAFFADPTPNSPIPAPPVATRR